MMARSVKPRLVIYESDSKWTIRIETMFKTVEAEFIPDVEFEESTIDGRRLRVRKNFYFFLVYIDVNQGTVRFENGTWYQKMFDINRNQELQMTRWVDENDQQRIVRIKFVSQI